ncbi:N-6 DNA methylase [Acetonema longum]|uniref:site-specific DNA-methyltransferase (adenine-specific) n=1 Tax=Acetonema longum DSM 6540 TaxID=1009370 RepID=F7NEZ3_9FIRM|nr:TaqI-like C-terminal specificity domain-containing protein [Acetonema longum]EGO65554.1 putative methyltransferase [Acetonema longum DSM 6540]
MTGKRTEPDNPGLPITGEQYEKSMAREVRKALGLYYTPGYIIDYILQRTVSEIDVRDDPFVSILDPACGSGSFLLAAYDILRAKFVAALPELQKKYGSLTYEWQQGNCQITLSGGEYWQEEHIHYHILTHCLFGADIDRAAVRLAAEHLSLRDAACEVWPRHLIACDSLMHWEARSQPAGETESAAAGFWQRTFDYIVGNPPYIPITQMTQEQKQYYRARYQTATGRMNAFALFLERCIAKTGKKAGFIVPGRLLLNTQYGSIRRLVLENTWIEEIFETDAAVFPEAVVDTVILILNRNKRWAPGDKTLIRRMTRAGCSEQPVEQNRFLATDHAYIQTHTSTAEMGLLQTIRSRSALLGDIAQVRDGIIQGRVGNELFLGEKPTHDGYAKPVLFGQDIHCYQLTPGRQYIWYHSEKLTALERQRTAGREIGLRLREPGIFERPKILSRQTADRIIACMDETGHYYMNTLHSAYVTDPEFNPWYVLAVLNSQLSRFYYTRYTGEAGQAYAQVKIANLKGLPIPRADRESQAGIAHLARQLQNPSTPHDHAGRQVLFTEIDARLFQLLRLTPEEVSLAKGTGER